MTIVQILVPGADGYSSRLYVNIKTAKFLTSRCYGGVHDAIRLVDLLITCYFNLGVIMKSVLIPAIFSLLFVGSAHAQEGAQSPLTVACAVHAPSETKTPRLVLGSTKAGSEVSTFVQISIASKLSGALKGLEVKVEPFNEVLATDGLASNAENAGFVRAIVTDGWGALLNRLKRGETLTIKAGSETFSVPLKGSGVAVNALIRCAR
mgnify:CR=1 FL=1